MMKSTKTIIENQERIISLLCSIDTNMRNHDRYISNLKKKGYELVRVR